MASMKERPSANFHCRKRSYDLVVDHDLTFRSRPPLHRQHGGFVGTVVPPRPSSPSSPGHKRRFKTLLRSTTMPVHIVPTMSTNYSAFTTQFYGTADDYSMEREHEEATDQEAKLPFGQLNTDTRSFNQHTIPFSINDRGSIVSLATDSTDISPATSQSSPPSLFTDPSPSSSPESASSNPPISPFKSANMRSSNHDRPRTGDQTEHPLQQTETQTYRSESPNPSTRNVKNLSLNMSAPLLPRPATSHGAEGHSAFSAPGSPLKEALRSGRKKPTNLTIRTPGFNQQNFLRTTPDIPPTPSSKPSLLGFQSSPSLFLATPTTAASSNPHLSIPSFTSGHSRPGSDSSFSSISQSINGALPGVKEEEEAHKSQETQEKGYPEGPIQIYETGVWLYLEPTLDEARNFDVIFNVAKEIKNPFEESPDDDKTVMSIWREDSNIRHSIGEPTTAMSELSFKSAWEVQPDQTPITPRPVSAASRREPEYFHIAWDHNTEILEDLYPLCRLIDERVQSGKKVLIHCQLGVSRSASLVIAYGLYKGYQPDFHSMYMQVKGRSQWVGPNMSLIYQLTDFRSKVAKGDYKSGGRQAPVHWFRNTQEDSPTHKDAGLWRTISERENIETKRNAEDKTPQAKTLRSLKLDKELPPVPLFPKEEKQEQAKNLPQLAKDLPCTPAPPIVPIKTLVAPPTPPKHESLASKRPAIEPRPLPFRKLAGYASPALIPPHRPRSNSPQMAIQISRPASQVMDLASQEPSTPSVLSPRATEFLASPWGLSSHVGELAVSGGGLKSGRSMRSFMPPDTPSPWGLELPAEFLAQRSPAERAKDPRSPHNSGLEGEVKVDVLRSIDGLL